MAWVTKNETAMSPTTKTAINRITAARNVNVVLQSLSRNHSKLEMTQGNVNVVLQSLSRNHSKLEMTQVRIVRSNGPQLRKGALHRSEPALNRSEEHTSELQSPCNLV